jgi:spore coat protein H
MRAASNLRLALWCAATIVIGTAGCRPQVAQQPLPSATPSLPAQQEIVYDEAPEDKPVTLDAAEPTVETQVAAELRPSTVAVVPEPSAEKQQAVAVVPVSAPAAVTAIQTVQVAVAAAPVEPPKVAQKQKATDDSKAFFERGEIPQLKIVLSQQEEQKLRQDQKRFVECALIENGQTSYKKVSVKLKGAAGSFRNLDDRPAFTLKMKKKDERFHGLDKFHLNNSVQDESYLNELIGSHIYRAAGYPASRITHARVWLNDRDLGFYVLKEGLDEQFLERNFGDAKGNLYDGGFCVDIDTNLEKDAGDGPDDYSDLKALVAACREGDDAKRNQLIPQKLDVDTFLKFVAIERMLCHWDGYIQNRNNYRVYFRSSDQKAMFLPHGMDQLFQDTNFACFNDPGQIVGSPLFRNIEWKSKYRQQVKDLLPLFAPEKLHATIDQAHARIRPVLASIHDDRAKQFDGRVKEVKDRLAIRAKTIQDQILALPPEPLKFDQNPTQLVDEWQPKPDGDAKLEIRKSGGEDCYVIEVGPSNRTTSSWRRKVLLARGRYQVEALGRVSNVAEIPGDTGKGLGIRLSGAQRQNQMLGTTNWEKLTHPIEVTEEARQVELVAELRSISGIGAYKVGSLKITKLP